MKSSFLIVLIGLLRLDTCKAAARPETVQVDLVFPRNNSVSQPIYPFPVVFAITNAQLIFPHPFLPSWSLHAGGLRADPTPASGDISFPGWSESPEPPARWVQTWAIDGIVNSTAEQFFVHYTVASWDACLSNSTTLVHGSQIVDGHIRFNVSKEGQLPNDGLEGSCGQPVRGFRFHGMVNDFDAPGRQTCPLVDYAPDNTPGLIEECGFRVEQSDIAYIADEMLLSAGCNGTDQTWPNATGLIGPCPGSRSAGWVFGAVDNLIWSIVLSIVISMTCCIS